MEDAIVPDASVPGPGGPQAVLTAAVAPATAPASNGAPAATQGLSRPLTRDDIQKVDDHRRVQIPITEWGGSVWVRSMTGTERDTWEASLVSGKGANRDVNTTRMRAKLAVITAVDQGGNQLFIDADVRWLSEKNAAALERIFDAARELNGLTTKDIQELTAELGKDQSSDSGTA